MFKVSHNRAALKFVVETVTPLSIRAGQAGLDPTGADLTCVRTHHHTHGRTVYIPGSSLKGVVRSSVEARLRAQRYAHLGGSAPILGACDPTVHRNSCARHSRLGETSDIYRANCVACRLFGSLSVRGRCAIRDLYPFSDATQLSEREQDNLARANRVEVRHGVFIGRISGSAVGLFDQEMIPAGVRFYGEVVLQNYQTWQLGLLLSGFDELSEGFAQLGSSKTRGLGVVRVDLSSLIHEQRLGSNPVPMGLGDLVDDSIKRAYGLFAEQPLPASEGTVRGLLRRFAISDTGALARWRAAGDHALSQLDASAKGGS